MDCEKLNGLLDKLMDGELTDDERAAMTAHGRECPDCAAAIRATLQMKALFDQMEPEADVPLAVQAKWRGAVREEAKQRRSRRLVRWVASAAAAVVAVVGIGLALGSNRAPKQAVDAAPLIEAEEAAEGAFMDEAEFAQPLMAMDAGEGAAKTQRTALAADNAADMAAPAAGAVIEADGALEAEEDLVELEEAAPAECAALALRAPACELAIRVEDVETACARIRDLAEEYDGSLEEQPLGDGGENLYVELPADGAGDFLSAVAMMDVGDEAKADFELAGDGEILVLLSVSAAE